MTMEKIKFLRERIGISQVYIATNILNIDKSLYGRYEKDKQTIPIKHLVTLCDYFKIRLDYIFNFIIENEDLNFKNVKKEEAGKRLKEFRKENKITQEKLAYILNTTQSVIADYERARYLIATPFLYTICKKYNISADYLLGRIDSPKYLK